LLERQLSGSPSCDSWCRYRHTLKPVSKRSWRRTRPGLKGPAETAGRGKAGLKRDVADVQILLRQQLACFGNTGLFHELRVRQVVICQPPLQGARANVQLLRDHHQRRTSGGQQPRNNVTNFTDRNSGLVYGCCCSGIAPRLLSLVPDRVTCLFTPLEAPKGTRAPDHLVRSQLVRKPNDRVRPRLCEKSVRNEAVGKLFNFPLRLAVKRDEEWACASKRGGFVRIFPTGDMTPDFLHSLDPKRSLGMHVCIHVSVRMDSARTFCKNVGQSAKNCTAEIVSIARSPSITHTPRRERK